MLPEKRLLHNYFRYPAKIVNIVHESQRVKSFYLDLGFGLDVKPGQYVMVWLPGYEEIPISVSLQEEDIIRLTIACVGDTTKAIHNLTIGDRLIIRGPYGRPFKLTSGNIILLGGGYGVAPLIFALHKVSNLKGKKLFVTGARTNGELLFIDEAKKLGAQVIVTTEDGSAGYRGVVTDILDSIPFNEYECILVCGPEAMMKKVYNYILENKIDINAQFSLERYIKCGLGVCGSCVLDGLRVCRDGPVFTLDELKGTSFGLYRRDSSGRKISI